MEQVLTDWATDLPVPNRRFRRILSRLGSVEYGIMTAFLQTRQSNLG